ncbi:MAG: nucleotidyltransferase family protein [Elusimicrobia bacterium]|nr:nucleotidyltransferase family protein [Elusimicrobiota bacterium]
MEITPCGSSGRPKKAFLLAAGLGTRLWPLTRKTPKCLLPLGGKPILHWWIKLLESLGVEEALVNLHHLAGQVEDFARGSGHALRLRLFHEPRLLGSAGTISANRDFVGNEPFWICYADTLVAADLKPLVELHRRELPPLTSGLFKSSDPKACGILELGSGGRIVSFEEKPAFPRCDLACAGVFVASPALWGYLPAGCGDIGRDVMPGLVGRAFGRLLRGTVIDIGTPQAYGLARKRWAELGLSRRFGEKA